MNKEIQEKKENQKEQTAEKRQPAYRKEAVSRAMNHTLNFTNGVGKGLEKSVNSLGNGVEKTLQHVKNYMDSFDM